MKPSYKSGFTIIETMLFLGITGLLVMGILVGAGTSINIQRYHDSIVSLQSVLQQQYTEVANVSNDSLGDLACGHGDGSSTTDPRGQSDCMLMGRYITTSDGRNLSIKGVIGYAQDVSILSSSKNDIDVLKLSRIQISPASGETYQIEWGSSLVRSGTGNPAQFSMLIVRSPVSGVVRTFIDPIAVVAEGSVATLIDTASLAKSVKACVNSNGLFTGGRSAIVVNPGATSASGIETQGEAISGC